jgi:hypothetical protein
MLFATNARRQVEKYGVTEAEKDPPNAINPKMNAAQTME